MFRFEPFLRDGLLRLSASQMRCRGCLGPLQEGAQAGLCGACWSGLVPLGDQRCPRCALNHDPDSSCADPVAWTFGDALWDYHGGRPALGSMLMSGIKSGEQGWMDVLMARVSESPLPSFAGSADLVTAAPTAFHRRWMRGFDLAEEAARGIADRLGVPFRRTLRKDTWIRRQAGRTQSDRRKLAKKTIGALRKAAVGDKIILLVDDVWTTGTTLLRCAQALREAGASEVRVLTLFRAT